MGFCWLWSLGMSSEHIVKSFDEELKQLSQMVAQMGGLAEAQLQAAIEALVARDAEGAARVVQGDVRIDQLERQISNQTIRMLALRQPMAQDLRQIVAALKISSDIERIGDYSANVAKRAIALTQSPPMRPVGGIARMGRLVQQIIKDTLDAFSDNDADKAVAAWKRDQDVDDMYNSLFRELLTYMMEDPRNIGPSTHLMFIAKNIERIGDHATNVAEIIHFLVRGEDITEARPKSDKTSFTVVNAPEDKA
jgi:phosphate transport system protein